jgi:short-subunit dehydrogenase
VNLDGATVLVTGASSGIGAATAELLARRGAKALLVGRDTDALTALAQRTGGRFLAADLARSDTVPAIVDWAGEVDVLVCNAGVGFAGSLADMPEHSVDELVTVNLTAHLRLTRLLLPAMLTRGRGQLAFVSSIAGCLGVADEAVYSATKSGLRTFADSVRLAVAGSGVGVSVLVPGVVDTPFFDRRGRPYDRSRPRPVPATKAAAVLVAAIERNRPEVFIPAWLRFPARLHGAAPALVQALERRFG